MSNSWNHHKNMLIQQMQVAIKGNWRNSWKKGLLMATKHDYCMELLGFIHTV